MFRAFPNPFREAVTLRVESSGRFRFRISNALGQTLREAESQGGQELNLSLSGLPPGLYLLSVLEEGRPAQTEKLLKE